MPSAVKRVNVKRVYEKPARGRRIPRSVDRLWPRGLKKSEAALHSWLRDLAPRTSCGAGITLVPARGLHSKRYLRELALPQAAESLTNSIASPMTKPLTLLFASK